MKRVAITGVTKGIGKAMAEFFAGHGWEVAGCGRSEHALERMRMNFPAPHRFSRVDVAEDPDVAGWCVETLEHGGVPDLLINNAALIAPSRPLWELPPEATDPVVDVNVKGVINVLRHFVPPMIARKSGVIVNISSGWGRSTSPGVATYCATKWAIEGLTAALAQELPEGLAAVALNPGIIDTEMLRGCFGESAAAYPTPEEWIHSAGPFLLRLSASDNGQPLTVPGAVTS